MVSIIVEFFHFFFEKHFAQCWHSAKFFFFFFKKIALPSALGPDTRQSFFFYFLKKFLCRVSLALSLGKVFFIFF